MREGRAGDRPAIVLGADQLGARDEDTVEEHLVELFAARHLPERPHVHARRLHVADEVAESLGFRAAGAREQDAPARELRIARPHLLAGHRPAAGHRLGTRPERGQIRAGARLREELAPELVGGQDRRQEAPLLLLGAVRDERRPDQVHTDAVDDLRCARRRQLLLQDVVLDRRRPTPAVCPRPLDAHPPATRQRPLPTSQRLDLVRQRCRRHRPRHMVPQPCPELAPKRLLRRRER